MIRYTQKNNPKFLGIFVIIQNIYSKIYENENKLLDCLRNRNNSIIFSSFSSRKYWVAIKRLQEFKAKSRIFHFWGTTGLRYELKRSAIEWRFNSFLNFYKFYYTEIIENSSNFKPRANFFLHFLSNFHQNYFSSTKIISVLRWKFWSWELQNET